MGPDSFQELEGRASRATLADEVKSLETRIRVQDEIALMESMNKILRLTEEEEAMLRSFRRFKLRMRKNGQVFTWQTTLPEGVQIAEQTVGIIDPRETLVTP